jgi:hypothetical protein
MKRACAFVIVLAMLGCGAKSTGGSDGGGGTGGTGGGGTGGVGGGGGGTASGGDMATLTDAMRCSTACAKMISCGVRYDSTQCNNGCNASTVFLPCIRTAALDDCNALAMCAFQQFGHDACGGTSGVPSGTATCNTTASCEASCNVSGPQPACSCNCIKAASPGIANALLVNNQCALALCATQCGPQGSGTACNSCAASMCASQHSQCASQ